MRAMLLSTLMLAACAAKDDASLSECERAERIVHSCGATLPMLDGQPCTGATRIASKCIVEHGKDCSQLVDLPHLLDVCSDTSDDTIDDTLEVPVVTPLPDPVPEPSQPVLTFATTVAAGEHRLVDAGRLTPGVYLASLTGTGDTDLFMRAALAPAPDAFDCQSVSPTSIDACAVTLSVPQSLFVLLVGVADAEVELKVVRQ